jgi:hypothetical protein
VNIQQSYVCVNSLQCIMHNLKILQECLLQLHIIIHKIWKKSQLLKYVLKNHSCHDHNLNLQPTLEMNNKMPISILKQIKGFKLKLGCNAPKLEISVK